MAVSMAGLAMCVYYSLSYTLVQRFHLDWLLRVACPAGVCLYPAQVGSVSSIDSEDEHLAVITAT